MIEGHVMAFPQKPNNNKQAQATNNKVVCKIKEKKWEISTQKI